MEGDGGGLGKEKFRNKPGCNQDQDYEYKVHPSCKLKNRGTSRLLTLMNITYGAMFI